MVEKSFHISRGLRADGTIFFSFRFKQNKTTNNYHLLPLNETKRPKLPANKGKFTVIAKQFHANVLQIIPEYHVLSPFIFEEMRPGFTKAGN